MDCSELCGWNYWNTGIVRSVFCNACSDAACSAIKSLRRRSRRNGRWSLRNLYRSDAYNIASGLVRLADSLGKAVGLIATDAGTGQLTIIPIGIWSFILCTIAIMGASFLIKHDA
jgi:hypothetical protein